MYASFLWESGSSAPWDVEYKEDPREMAVTLWEAGHQNKNPFASGDAVTGIVITGRDPNGKWKAFTFCRRGGGENIDDWEPVLALTRD